jgi:hypothetical protein
VVQDLANYLPIKDGGDYLQLAPAKGAVFEIDFENAL